MKICSALLDWSPPVATEEELGTAQAIVTMAHGRMRDGKAGPGNAIMACVTRALWEKYRLPILPQEEISMADPSLPCHTIISGSDDGRSNMKWNTRIIAERQAEICKKNGWTKVIVVAFPLHQGRARAVYRKLGLEPLFAEMPARLKDYMHPNLVPGGIVGIQTIPRFVVREFLCRILFLWKGWM
jgi:hypothetical protein